MNSSPKWSFVLSWLPGTAVWTVPALLLITVFGAVVGAQSSSTEAADLREIEQVALDYLEGGRDADFNRLSGAFHDSARLQFVKDGVYTEWAIADYLEGRKGAKPREATVKVHSVDLAGSCAVAKVESDYGKVGFVDYLSLLKVEGRWVIVNKVFHRS